MPPAAYTLIALTALLASAVGKAGPAAPPDRATAPAERLRVGTLASSPGRCAATPNLRGERRLIEAFALSIGRQPRWVCFDERHALRQALDDNLIDMAGSRAGLSGTPTGAARHYSLPIEHSREAVLTRLRRKATSLDDLSGSTLALRRATIAGPLIETAAIKAKARVVWYDTAVRTTVLIEDLRAARIDALTLEYDEAMGALARHADVRLAFVWKEPAPRRWAFAPGLAPLAAVADRFLERRHVAFAPLAGHRGDLRAIRERGLLRVTAIPERHRFFVSRGRLMGFDYELLHRFADSLDLELELLVPEDPLEARRWLLSGFADVEATLEPTPRKSRHTLFTRPYREARYALVARTAQAQRPTDASAQAPVLVSRLGPSAELLGMRGQLGASAIAKLAPAAATPLDILHEVARGRVPLALVDRDHLAAARRLGLDLDVVEELAQPLAYRWATRSSSPELARHLDAFIGTEFKGLFYNVLHRRYFERTRIRARTDNHQYLSPYDGALRAAAGRHGFDWRLLAAQMYVESGFNPKARSAVGAQGLMQILPDTGHALGLADGAVPESSIEAGVRYLARLRGRYDRNVPAAARTWFALAAYNAGFSRIAQARRLAQMRDLNEHRWFGHVEKAMSDLDGTRNPLTGKRVRCRCSETIHYVRRVRARYSAYRQLLTEPAGSPGSAHEDAALGGPTKHAPSTPDGRLSG